jgi:hypothetical protein
MLGELLRGKFSDRKLRLFSVACCRRIWHLLTDGPSRHAVEIAEKFADGAASLADLASVRRSAYSLYDCAEDDCDDGYIMGGRTSKSEYAARTAAYACKSVAHDAVEGSWIGVLDAGLSETELALLVFELFANPFCPATFDPTWRTSNVAAVAQSIYEERVFERLPILADALEDAGCTSEDILNHCRQPGEHVRGCWALDVILGRE